MTRKRPNEKPLDEQSPRMRMLRGDTAPWPNAGEDLTAQGQDRGGRASRGLPGKKAPSKGGK